jgi:gluconokinase
LLLNVALLGAKSEDVILFFGSVLDFRHRFAPHSARNGKVASMIFLVMGVAGSGKSTVGRLLAKRLDWVFLEADDFHSEGNKEKMHRGVPLTDADRLPWLDAMHEKIRAQDEAGKNVVLACSALKDKYRQRLTAALDVKVVYLRGPKKLIADRLRQRSGHFAGEAILDDQFAVLEEPGNALVVDIAEKPEQIVEEILRKTT